MQAAVNQVEEAKKHFLVNILGDTFLQAIFHLTGARLYMCQPSSAIIWQYTDPLVQELHKNFILRIAGLNYPSNYVNLQMNDSIVDTYPSIIHTGVKNISQIGMFEQWKGSVGSLNIWPNGNGANAINGTEGLLFSPFLSEDDILEVFSDDALRTIKLVYADTLELNGIRVFQYRIKNSTFESAFMNPENARWGSWNPEGLFYLGPIQDPTVPVFGSKPHFLDADPVLREKVVGMVPDRSKHETALHIDPITGASIQFALRLQINVQVNQSSAYGLVQIRY